MIYTSGLTLLAYIDIVIRLFDDFINSFVSGWQHILTIGQLGQYILVGGLQLRGTTLLENLNSKSSQKLSEWLQQLEIQQDGVHSIVKVKDWFGVLIQA